MWREIWDNHAVSGFSNILQLINIAQVCSIIYCWILPTQSSSLYQYNCKNSLRLHLYAYRAVDTRNFYVKLFVNFALHKFKRSQFDLVNTCLRQARLVIGWFKQSPNFNLYMLCTGEAHWIFIKFTIKSVWNKLILDRILVFVFGYFRGFFGGIPWRSGWS
jgi:hypothetical protein